MGGRLIMIEQWKQVDDFPNYEVSNQGQVRNKKTQKILKQFLHNNYAYCGLYNNSIPKQVLIHRLVAMAFVPLENEQYQDYSVDHIDNNRLNNKADNLQWLKQKDNLEKSYEVGNQKKKKRRVYQYKDGLLINEYESVNEAFRQTAIRHISEAARGVRASAGGYVWSYEQLGGD